LRYFSSLTCLLCFVCTASVFAQNEASAAETQTNTEQEQTQQSGYDKYLERVKERESSTPGVAYESVDKTVLPQHQERWSDFLPILGKEAREQGYVLPLPFGISLGGLTQEQPFKVSRIGLAFNGQENDAINSAIDNSITARDLTVSDTTFTLRFDAWILPFWNVYGIAGRTDATARLKLDVDLEVPTLLLAGLGVGGGPLTPGATRCGNLGLSYNVPPPTGGSCQGTAVGIPVKVKFDGDVLGYGTTIAGGYGDFFGMFDVNYTEADINIAIEKTEQTVYSARIGWAGSVGIWNGQIWVGGMKQDINQELYLKAPGTNAAVIIDQHASSPYNYLVGGAWNFNEEWQLILESSFLLSDRNQFMFQLVRRF
jgi:hypothetical protein